MAENRKTIILLKGYNNYFNRTITYSDAIGDYENDATRYCYINNINFKPNDDVSTEIVLNLPYSPVNYQDMKDSDYLLVVNGETIESRWFIQHAHRTRQGQYQFTLRRDVIADNIQGISLSPIYVERGWLNENNPLIYADEGMQLNQIKRDEVLLKDKTGVGWIVGYLTNETLTPFEEQGKEYAYSQRTGSIIPDNVLPLSALADKMGLTQSQLVSIINFNGDQGVRVDKVSGNFTFKAWVNLAEGSYLEWLTTYWTDQSFNGGSATSQQARFLGDISLYRIGTWSGAWIDNQQFRFFKTALINSLANRITQYKTALKNDLYNILGRIVLTSQQYEVLRNFANTYNYVSYNGVIYSIKPLTDGTVSRKSYHYPNDNQTISNIMNGVNGDLSSYTQYSPSTTPPLKIEYNASQVGIVLEANSINSYRVHISNERNKPSDCPYSMFAIPCGGFRYAETEQTTTYDTQTQSVSGSSNQPIPINIQFQKQQGYSIADPTIGGQDISVNFTSDFSPSPAYELSLTETNDFWVFSGYMVGQNCRLSVNVRFTVQSSGSVPIVKYTQLTFDDSISLAIEIAKKLGGDVLYLYDLQLLPYCPALDMIDATSNAVLTYSQSLTEHSDFDWIELETSQDVWEKKGLVLYPRSCNIRTTIDYSLGLKTSKKVDSNCDNYRILSPNGSGGFDFNVAKNGGSVDFFVVDCTYKPYTPFIRVAPQFQELYGNNYHDMRGLVCGGDFSLPLLTDAWTQYQLQNKNYANIFDRDIQNLDFKQSREQLMQEISMPFKALSAGVVGGTMGGQATGSPYGAIAGAVIGGVAGTVGSGVDLAMATELRNENKRYAIDKFNFKLGNIKALPTSLARNTSYTVNNKIFPYLEYYTCTEEEREAFERKIEWDSMSVMKIGYIGDYQVPNEPHYFKGRLIRGIEIEADNHVLQEINDELEKGVYI